MPVSCAYRYSPVYSPIVIESLETFDYFTRTYWSATLYDHFNPFTFNILTKLQSNFVKCGRIDRDFRAWCRPFVSGEITRLDARVFSLLIYPKNTPQPNYFSTCRKKTNKNKIINEHIWPMYPIFQQCLIWRAVKKVVVKG